MSLPPHRSLPPGFPQTYQSVPQTTVSPPAKRTLGSYFSLELWHNLLRQAARHRYWMKGAAIAYGAACALLLSFLALVSAATLKTAIQTPLTAGLTLWLPTWATAIDTLMQEMTSEWSGFHRWLLLLSSGGLGIALWLKAIGLTQQIIRSDGDLASHLVPTLRHRLITVIVAGASAGLTLLALGLVLMTLPNNSEAIATPSFVNLSQRFFTQSLRWCLALSTIALGFGLLYRSSQKSSAKGVPILPGTIFATLLWLATGIVLKSHLASLNNQHWLWQVCSTTVLGLTGLYVATLGLLLGGQYNKLINRYYPRSRSRQPGTQPPPPSFDSFKIQKPPYR